MRSDLVKCGERVDDLQNGLFVIQDPKKFCFGMDAVLLSGFARVKKGEVALDMGLARELFRFCFLTVRMGSILRVWRFSMSVRRWLTVV